MGGFLFLLFHGMIGIAVFAVFGLVLYRSISRWRKDEKSPVLTVDAVVVAKRKHTSRNAQGCEVCQNQLNTSYYATFQFESGDRLELRIPYDEIGYLVEGDNGKLTFQGSRFIRFERT